MSPDAIVLAERWALLLPEQRMHVARALKRAERDSMRCSRSMARKAASSPQPYRSLRQRSAVGHASRAGALRIALLLLGALRAHP